MAPARSLLAALGWIGRQRTRAVAALVFLGIALPPLGELLKPYVTLAVMAILCIAFMRIDMGAFRSFLRRPALVLAASAWTMVAVPALLALVLLALGVEAVGSGLFVALMLQAATPPIMSGPAFAALMGLDATLVLATLIVTTTLTPLTAPLIAAAAGLELPLSPLALGRTLFLILGASAVIGLALRRVVGARTIARRSDEVDGINIIALFVFVSAVMGNVGAQIIEDALLVAGLTLLAFLVFGLLLATTHLVFVRLAGRRRALALALTTSQKNMGLMLGATGGLVPDLTWLYFALAQVPIYLSPALLQPVARKVLAQDGGDD